MRSDAADYEVVKTKPIGLNKKSSRVIPAEQIAQIEKKGSFNFEH